jgi:hypothetical protein
MMDPTLDPAQTYVIVGLTCLVIGSAGYALYGDQVMDEVTLNLPAGVASTAALALITVNPFSKAREKASRRSPYDTTAFRFSRTFPGARFSPPGRVPPSLVSIPTRAPRRLSFDSTPDAFELRRPDVVARADPPSTRSSR